MQLLSWRYRDPAALVAAPARIQPAETAYADHGGEHAKTLVNLTASEILDGSLDCGRPHGRGDVAHPDADRRADVVLEWDKQPDEMTPARLIGSEMRMTIPMSSSAAS